MRENWLTLAGENATLGRIAVVLLIVLLAYQELATAAGSPWQDTTRRLTVITAPLMCVFLAVVATWLVSLM